MPSETEAMALALVRVLYDATDGEAMHWQVIKRLDGATDEAVAFAAARGWIVLDSVRGVALTDVGRQIAEDLGQPLH